jgi:hypothetical protein
MFRLLTGQAAEIHSYPGSFAQRKDLETAVQWVRRMASWFKKRGDISMVQSNAVFAEVGRAHAGGVKQRGDLHSSWQVRPDRARGSLSKITRKEEEPGSNNEIESSYELF